MAQQPLTAGDLLDVALDALQEMLESGKPGRELPESLANHTKLQCIFAELRMLQQFTHTIAKGDLNQTLPLKGHMAGSLKSLQANLRHLTWQTQQIARGDFRQRVDFMGAFATAFNGMVAALAETRAQLERREAELSRTNAELQQEIVEHKRTEASLRESEQRYVRAESIAHVGYWERNFVEDKGTWSAETYRILGLAPDQSIPAYTNFLNFVHPDDREFVKSTIQRSLSSGEQFDVEYRIIRPDGTEREIHSICEVRGDAQGQLLGLVGTVHDMTEYKRAEHALRESEERYRSLFSNNHAVMLLIEPETGAIVDANPAAGVYYGYSQKDLLVKKITDINLLTQAQVFAEMQRARSEQRNYFEFRHRLASGEIRDVEVYSGPIQLRQKQLLYSIVHDITARKQIEAALKKSETTLAEAQRIAHLGSWEIDLVSGQCVWSDELFRICGLEPQSIQPTVELGFQLDHPDDRAADRDAFNNAVAEQRLYTIEKRIVRPDGSIRQVLSQGEVMYNESAQPVRVVGIFLDTTERKRLEAELRTAKELAESANQAKSEFLAHMSHELRTPLNGILGYTQILRRDKSLAEFQRSGLEIIEHSGAYLLNLIAEMLDLAKIEARRLELYLTDVALPEFLRGITAIIQIRVQQKGLAFHYEPAAELPAVIHADEQRLGQVLLNLLNNAVKFTDRGRVTFRVLECAGFGDLNSSGLQSFENARMRTLRFEVEDTGPGIPAEYLEVIFAPFKQVGDPMHKTEGSGLGLAISQQLVALMGGVIQVHSIPAQGSRFWFETAFPEGERSPDIKSQPPSAVSGFSGECKILIVDDHDSNRKLLRDMLQPLGFELREAENGPASIALAQTFCPDLILMDLMMPGMDGFEAIKHIRACSPAHRPPAPPRPVIIAVSADVFAETRRKIGPLGCQDFLPKPVRFEQLLEKLQAHLKLQWRYEPRREEWRNGLPSDAAAALVPPSQQELADLAAFAQIGDILEIEKYVNLLQARNPQYAPFAAQILAFRKKFQITRMQEFIREFITEEKTL